MATFLVDLWNSVFTPGPTPTLVLATNIAFGLLQTVLLALLVFTFSIHFLVLSVLCAGLWVSINWFVREVYIAQAEPKPATDKKEQAQPAPQQKLGEAEWLKSGKGRGYSGSAGSGTSKGTSSATSSGGAGGGTAGGGRQKIIQGKYKDSGAADSGADTETEAESASGSKKSQTQSQVKKQPEQSLAYASGAEAGMPSEIAGVTRDGRRNIVGIIARETTGNAEAGVEGAHAVGFNTAAAAKLAPPQVVPEDEGVRKRRTLAESVGDLSTDSEWEQVDGDNE